MPHATAQSIGSGGMRSFRNKKIEREVRQLLSDRTSFSSRKIANFVSGINGIKVHAYSMDQEFSTSKARIAWMKNVISKILPLQESLKITHEKAHSSPDASPDFSRKDAQLRFFASQDLLRLDKTLAEFIRCGTPPCSQLYDGLLLQALGRLTMDCLIEIRKLNKKVQTKPVGSRQRFANLLADHWERTLGVKPSATFFISKKTNDDRASPYIETLKLLINKIENKRRNSSYFERVASNALNTLKANNAEKNKALAIAGPPPISFT